MSSTWNHEGRFWTKWYPLLISKSHMSSELEREVQELSGGSVITKSESVLEYSDYKGLVSLSLNDFLEAKGPYQRDPRIDPYMKGISSYFNQDIYEILYLPSNKSPLEYQRLLSGSALMAETVWILPDWNGKTAALLLFSIILLLLSFGSFRFCIPAVAFLLSGFIVYAQGQSRVLLVLALTALFLRLFLMTSRGGLIYFLLPFLPLVTAFYMDLLQKQHLGLIAMVLLSFAAVLFWPLSFSFFNLKTKKRRRVFSGKDHSLFEPVSLLKKPSVIRTASNKGSAKDRPSFMLLGAALLCLILAAMNLPVEKILPAGIPSVVKSEGIWDYEGLVSSDRPGEIPNAADYIKHRAFQESFVYGGSYRLPVPGSRISFENYQLSEGRVFESTNSVLVFSESWYESRLEKMAESGPGKLLASESSPPVISPRYSEPVGISLQVLLVFAVFICLFVLIHLSGIHHASEYSGIRSSGKFVLRRKQQAA